TAPLSKLLEKIAGPIRPVHFKAVAKDGVRWMRSECLHQAIAHCMQVIFSGPAVVVIHHESFSANRRPFDLLSCVAGDEKQHGLRSFRSEEHTSELQSRFDLVCRLLLEKKKKK